MTLMQVIIHQPIENCTLWRYMPLEGLLWLLQQNCLWFTQLERFRDPYEGTANKALSWEGTVDGDLVFKPEKDTTHDLYVNCWHSNNDESAAMWDVYSKTSGVAITTTLARLQAALTDAPQKIDIAAIHYQAITPNLAAGLPWAIKRPSFAHEREVRAVFRDPECGQAGIGVPVNVAALIVKIHVSPEPGSEWVESVVADVVKTYDFTTMVKRSNLYTLL
jgi:hypothetical protein